MLSQTFGDLKISAALAIGRTARARMRRSSQRRFRLPRLSAGLASLPSPQGGAGGTLRMCSTSLADAKRLWAGSLATRKYHATENSNPGMAQKQKMYCQPSDAMI